MQDADYAAEQAREHNPPDRVYFNMLVLLAVFTVAEVLIYYNIGSPVTRAFILGAMLLVKFVAQIGWFTHLRYDDRRLVGVFAGCFIIAFSVVGALIWMMSYDGMWIGQQYQ